MYDARAVANKILEVAARQGVVITNLKLQKILYFVHGRFLLEQGKPLLDGEFEAWQYGPVFPTVYASFKEFGGDPILTKARAFDPVKRTYEDLPSIQDQVVERYVAGVLAFFGQMSAGQLVALTHVYGGPWDRTVSAAKNSANIGLRIKNETIRRHFAKFSIITSDGLDRSKYGDIHENAPYS